MGLKAHPAVVLRLARYRLRSWQDSRMSILALAASIETLHELLQKPATAAAFCVC